MLFRFCISPSYIMLRVTLCVIIYTVFGSEGQTVFLSSSCMFLDKKTLPKIKLNPDIKLTVFRGTGP